jgi:hypothetical protein
LNIILARFVTLLGNITFQRKIFLRTDGSYLRPLGRKDEMVLHDTNLVFTLQERDAPTKHIYKFDFSEFFSYFHLI